MKSESTFEAARCFLVRAPLFPVEDFFRLFEGKEVMDFYREEPLVREAVRVASPTLWEALEKGEGTVSLLKYLIRMTTRCTPFGLFSGVSMGRWGEKGVGFLDVEGMKARARPDMEWLMEAVLKRRESFRVRRHPLLKRLGGRFIIDYFYRSKDQQMVSIRRSALTEQIFELTREAVSIEELAKGVMEKMPKLEEEKVRGVIGQLLEQQFLWPCLIPSLLSQTPWKEVIEQLPLDQRAPFEEIEGLIDGYALSSEKLCEKMRPFAETKNYLQVDTAFPSTMVLPQGVAEEGERALEFLCRLSFPSDPFGLENYRVRFLDRYGVDRLVPVLELLGEESGLGVPEAYKGSWAKSESSSGEIAFRRWLHQAYVKALQEQRREIELLDKDIEKFVVKEPVKPFQPSLDAYFDLVAESKEALDRGDFYLVCTSWTWQGGATFGRFLDLFDKGLGEFFEKEEELNPNVRFVEVSYLPPAFRSYNVTIHPTCRGEVIDLSPLGKSTIGLEEIFVGADERGLFLTSRDGSVEFYATANNMLNPTYAPFVLRFLKDVSKSRYQLVPMLYWKELEEMPFLPRLRYGKVILAPAQWRLSFEDLGCSSKDSLEKFFKAFEAWAETWRMPRYVFLSYQDNRLLLDRSQQVCIDLMYRELKREKVMKLVEKVGQEGGQWVESVRGKHLVEITIPFLRRKRMEVSKKRPAYREVEVSKRWQLPGSGWLYVKFYLSEENQSSFLSQNFPPFIDFLKEQKIVEQWFFIRYRDPKPHLRIRLYGENVGPLMLPYLESFGQQLLKEGLIHEMMIGSYERELERYGGVEQIEQVEWFFCADTQTALALLKLNSKLPDYAIGALSILDMLPADKREGFFEEFKIDKTQLAKFREIKKDFLPLAQAIVEGDLSTKDPALHQAFSLRRETLAMLHQNYSHELFTSLVHMQCNRFFSLEKGLEGKARACACHALKTLRQGAAQRSLEHSFL